MAAESRQALSPVRVCRSGAGWLVGSRFAEGRELLVLPAPGGLVRLGKTAYRGFLRLLPAEGGRLVVVNHVDVESYLAGVLPKELYPNWHDEAYQAVAVAARTFAMYHMITFGRAHEYDLGDTQASQVYGGCSAETPTSRRAVDETRGVVLAWGEAGEERIFMAQYSACCGGRVNGAYVLRSARRVEPLEGGQVCTDCRDCPRYRWGPVRLAKSDVYAALRGRFAAAAELGGLRSIRITETTPHGRAVWAELAGPTGKTLRLRAEDIRLALLSDGPPAARGLYSMNCDVVDTGGAIEFRDGRGFGHGVGLCQWGAQAKARNGWSAEQILAFYYPGAKLFRVH
jgi:stage II sporulation protein D